MASGGQCVGLAIVGSEVGADSAAIAAKDVGKRGE
jgi:hypothetical protein